MGANGYAIIHYDWLLDLFLIVRCRALPSCYAEVWQAPYRCECNRLETGVTGVAKKNATMVNVILSPNSELGSQ